MTGPPPRQRPLSASWRDWIRTEGNWKGRAWAGPAFDAIVVGSGYGGSVAALRLAEKQYRVLLLERGSEYLPGEFPNDFSLLPKYFRANLPTRGAPLGSAIGLVEVHLGQGMVAVTGNGLGGGSLINAGVAMQPDADVFAQRSWPAAIRHDLGAGLEPFFAQARQELRVTPWRSGLPEGAPLAKTVALQRLGARLDAPVQGVQGTISPDHCTRCGDCAAGCNVPEAKGSLPQTYLRKAVATGYVQVVTQAEVYRFEPARSPRGEPAWQVHAFATDAQQQYASTREVCEDPRASGTGRVLQAPLLFVCAGTFGSTQLLQRSQARSPHRLAFSPALGTRLSGNGDSLSWLVDEPRPVASLGQGEAGSREWARVEAGERDFDATRIVGPTITAVADLRRGRPLQERLVVEDGAVPRAIAQVYRELLATASTLKSLDDWWFRPPAAGRDEDPLAASENRARHSQVLLVMGHDGSPGRLVWLDGSDRAAPYVSDPERLPTYQAQERLFARIGARHVHNPLWQAMPPSATGLMSGPKPQPTLSTVHPLGGCAMSDEPDEGVVNHLGQVWVRDPGLARLPPDATELPDPGPDPGARPQDTPNEPRLYKGLYVLDGAIVPTALGCNPLWTIAALAERALASLPRKTQAPLRQQQFGEARAPRALPAREVPVDALLHEVLLAGDLRVRGRLARALGAPRAVARFEADFSTPDLQETMRQPRHRLAVEACLLLGRERARPDDPEPQVVLRYVADGGSFEPLPAGAFGSGGWLTLRCLAEMVLAVLALPLLVRPFWLGLASVLLALWLLPFPRTLITWLVLRAARDFPSPELADAGPARWWTYCVALLKQLVHSSEKRVMRYRVPLRLEPPRPAAPPRLVLHASKTVVYRAGPLELLRWACRRGPPVQPLRATMWEQVMNARVRVVPARAPRWWPASLAGTFRMGFDNLTSSGLSAARRGARGAMELGRNGDASSGLLALASYPLLFLRFALKTRLLDFRLPSYSGQPRPDRAPDEETRLRLPGGGCAQPHLHWVMAPRGRSSADSGDESRAPLRLPLWRYCARDAQGEEVDPAITCGEWLGVPVQRARSVLLLHAFGQSGYSYTLKTTRQNLAEALLAAGFEVWVLEMRMSTRSGYAGDPCSIDQIAEHDVPAAVDYILASLRAAHPGRDLSHLQIAAFGQCIGAAALWMALLAGRLSHGVPALQHAGPDRPLLSKISHFMSSQVHPWVVGARGTQAKTWLPALLQAVWRRGAVPFAVRGPQDGVFLPVLDRVLASLPAPGEEDRRADGNEDAAATCRRIRFIEAPLFQHRNLNDATFAQMNLLFGEANLRLFTQARRFVDRERLVDEDGVNRYLTDGQLRRHAALPIQLLHGQQNELFDVQGAQRSFAGLGENHAGWQQRFCRRLDGRVGPVLVPGHGHLDVLIGEQAPQLVFPEVVHFLAGALQVAEHVGGGRPAAGWVARPPRIGPFLGWLREDGGLPVLRLSFVVEEGGVTPGQALPDIVLRYRDAAGCFRSVRPAPHWRPLLARAGTEGAVAQRVAWTDLRLEGDWARAQDWQVFTLHRVWQAQGLQLLPDGNAQRAHFDAELDAFLAQAVPGADPVVPPLALPGRPPADAAFRLPPASLAMLPRASRRVRFAAASCRHPGLGPDQGRVDLALREFLAAPAAADTAFALLLGDQIYADATAGLVDPTSPLERFFERHETAFRREGLGQLLAAMPVYMTPDDHEWVDGFPSGGPLVREPWPDRSAGGAWRRREEAARRVAEQAQLAFQRLQSPAGTTRTPRYTFEHGCVGCFVLDCRSGRERERPQMVLPVALKALERWLAAAPPDRLNVVATGSVVLPGMRGDDPAGPGCADNWQYAPQQRRQLLELLVRSGRPFVLLSGDYHVSGAARLLHGGRVVGAVVLAPPLHAPMPYANATPEAVFDDEVIDIDGQPLWMEFRPGGEIARGSGLGLLEVRRAGSGFALRYARELWTFETAQRGRHLARLALR